MTSRQKLNEDKKRFYAKINKTKTCWQWTAAKDKNGYGLFTPSSVGKMVRAHRLSYEWHYGVKPGKKFVCHKCDNPSCVKPGHLFLGTVKDNALDALNKGRLGHATPPIRKGEAHPRALLTDKEVSIIRKLYDPFPMNSANLAILFGVKKHVVERLLSGKTYTKNQQGEDI